ncbi:LuxR C-terminal-related transcriptional regulator [Granulicoccus sp. GXG6511]|uniref:helix-turn-helix transcriptional regulator n=1 Tax=Granulicoccus sp. GXG6511 TaxID=3381351 RepID=UPI003D7D7E43
MGTDNLQGLRDAVADDRVGDAIDLAAAVIQDSADEVAITEAATLIQRPVDPLSRARLHALAAAARLRVRETALRDRIEAQYAATAEPFHAGDLNSADLDALAREGRRAQLLDAIAALAWRADSRREHSRVQLLLASQAMTDGRWDAAHAHLSRAEASSGPGSDAAYLALPYRSAIAVMTGEGLAEVVSAVREAVESAPFFARGWLAGVLFRSGARAEAAGLWHSLALHINTLPESAAEFLVIGVDMADLCARLEDRETAPRLYEMLSPFAGQHAIAHATSPYEGPVDLALAWLAATLGWRDRARDHLHEAIEQCRSIHAPAHLALALAASASLEGAGSRARVELCARARAVAQVHRMSPLLASLGQLEPRASGLLTARESEVVDLVVIGLTNGQIADRLHLSERTVESHVSHAMTKFGVRSRTALAAASAGVSTETRLVAGP